jgi:hypothetical protein
LAPAAGRTGSFLGRFVDMQTQDSQLEAIATSRDDHGRACVGNQLQLTAKIGLPKRVNQAQ